MKITKELMDHILKETDSPSVIAQMITIYQDIEDRIKKTIHDYKEIKKEYDAKLLENKKIRKRIQVRCDHPVSSYFGDPSGGNDSFRQCDICGYEW